MNRPVMKKGILKRLIKMLFESYPRLLVVTIGFITLNAVVSSLPAIFMKNVIGIVNDSYKSGDWSSVSNEVLKFVLILGILYINPPPEKWATPITYGKKANKYCTK